MQLAGYLPFSGSTTTAAISGANVPLNLTPLFQQMVAPNAAASLAVSNHMHYWLNISTE